MSFKIFTFLISSSFDSLNQYQNTFFTISENPDVITIIMSAIGILISFLTLRLAYKINRQIGISHLKKMQIKHIHKIIEMLNQPQIEVSFANHKCCGTTESGKALKLNFFEISNYDQIDTKLKNHEFEDSTVLFKYGSNQIIDTRIFVNHPLTPKSIADELLNFHVSISDNHRAIENEKIVILRTELFAENVDISTRKSSFLTGDAPSMTTWLSMKKCSTNLRIEIEKWLGNAGIDDLNLRMDFNRLSI